MKLGCIVRHRVPGQADFVALGENSLDTMAVGPGPWMPGAKLGLTQLTECPGGQAATAAIACARLGWRVRYAGVVGDDGAAATVRETLARHGADPVLVVRAGVPTRRAVVLVDGRTGDRTVLEWRGAALSLEPGEIADQTFRDTRVLLVDGCDPGSATRAAEIARAAGVRTLVDVDRAGPDIEALLCHIDVVILPASVAVVLGKADELGRSLASIGRETRARAVVATLGADGALAWCPRGEAHIPACVVSVVDTTGAGDAFRAGFAASWLGSAGTDPDLETLVSDANLVAGLNCRALGAQAALPGRSEVPDRLWGEV